MKKLIVKNVIIIGIIAAVVIYILLSFKNKESECNNCPYCSSCNKNK